MSGREFERIRFLYIGSSDVARDLAYYVNVLGAVMLWDRSGFGTRVAAVKLVAEGPLVLLAGHRPVPSCLPVFEVRDLEKKVVELKKKGWSSEKGPLEIPNGPCYVFKDPGGNELAIFQDDRPSVFGTT